MDRCSICGISIDLIGSGHATFGIRIVEKDVTTDFCIEDYEGFCIEDYEGIKKFESLENFEEDIEISENDIGVHKDAIEVPENAIEIPEDAIEILNKDKILIDPTVNTSRTDYILTLESKNYEKYLGPPLQTGTKTDKHIYEWKFVFNESVYSIYDWKGYPGWHLSGPLNRNERDLQKILYILDI